MRRFVFALLVAMLGPFTASAALVFSNLEITSSSFSVEITGTFPNQTPNLHQESIFISNPNLFADPGFILPESETSTVSHNWSGPYYLGGGFTIDNSPYGDL